MSRRRVNLSVSPKVRWARRVRLAAIVLACGLLAATALLLLNYRAPRYTAPPPLSPKRPATSGTASPLGTESFIAPRNTAP